jgi:triacylglycerol esterase/lipase EstA (alpha/beta hydrolase family)
MGGQTIRMLVHLLNQGAPEEVAASGTNTSALFRGGRKWVHTVTSVDSPHDGSSLVPATPLFVDVIQLLVTALAGIFGIVPEDIVYDFKLDQFGLHRTDGEGFVEYMARVFAAPIWDVNYKDLSPFDLSPEGAAVMNNLTTPAEAEVFYFSYSHLATYKSIIGDYQEPDLTMWFFMWPFASTIGSFTMNQTGDPIITKDAWPNDGLVSMNSQDGPSFSSKDKIVPFGVNTTVWPGQWTYMGEQDGLDHIECISIGVIDMKDYYLDVAKFIRTFPDVTPNTGSKGHTFSADEIAHYSSPPPLSYHSPEIVERYRNVSTCSALQEFEDRCAMKAELRPDTCVILGSKVLSILDKCDCGTVPRSLWRKTAAMRDAKSCESTKHRLIQEFAPHAVNY